MGIMGIMDIMDIMDISDMVHIYFYTIYFMDILFRSIFSKYLQRCFLIYLTKEVDLSISL